MTKNFGLVSWTALGGKNVQELWDHYGPNGTKLIAYIHGQQELAPSTGTEHTQSWISLVKRARCTALNKLGLVGPKYSLSVLTRGQAAADSYVSKERSRKPGCSPQKFGHLVRQGQTNAYNVMHDHMAAGSTIHDLLESREFDSQFIRNLPNIKGCLDLYRKDETPNKFLLTDYWWPKITITNRCVVLVGKSGIGKTQFARAHNTVPGTTVLVTCNEDLKRITPKTLLIVFDDISETMLDNNNLKVPFGRENQVT